MPGDGVGLATSEDAHFTKGDLIAQYIGRYLLLTKSQTDELFHPIFFDNHERLIELGPIVQPIVYDCHASTLKFQTVSLLCVHLTYVFNKHDQVLHPNAKWLATPTPSTGVEVFLEVMVNNTVLKRNPAKLLLMPGMCFASIKSTWHNVFTLTNVHCWQTG